MTTATESIQKAFDIALKQFGAANSIVIALENINAPTSTATPYLAGYFLPAPIDQADLYFTDRRSGIYQIDIHYASHLGSAPINKMTDLLNVAFKPSTVFAYPGWTVVTVPLEDDLSIYRDVRTCLEITNFSFGRVTVENGWATRPVSITFDSYTARL